MKNFFKLGFVALALSLTVVACGTSDKTAESTDTVGTDTVLSDTTVTDTVVTTTVETDTTVKTN